MKKYVLVCSVLLLTACASSKYELKDDLTPPPKVVEPPKPPVVTGAERIERMERREVIQAVTECEDAGMKPYVEYVTQRTDFGKVMVPINVHCDPKRVK